MEKSTAEWRECCNDFSESDWDVFEDPDEETLSGKWFDENMQQLFTFHQRDNGVLDGYYIHEEHCWIRGKVSDEDVVFFQNWRNGATIVKGKLFDRMRTMNGEFEYIREKRRGSGMPKTFHLDHSQSGHLKPEL